MLRRGRLFLEPKSLRAASIFGHGTFDLTLRNQDWFEDETCWQPVGPASLYSLNSKRRRQNLGCHRWLFIFGKEHANYRSFSKVHLEMFQKSGLKKTHKMESPSEVLSVKNKTVQYIPPKLCSQPTLSCFITKQKVIKKTEWARYTIMEQ